MATATATATAVPQSFSASGVIRGYHMYQRIWTPRRRKTNNSKSTGKQTRLIRFQRGNAIEILDGIMFDFYPELPHFIQISTTLLAWFPRYRKRSILRELVVVCNTHFRLSSLAQDSFRRQFLIMRHISIVAS